MRGDERTKPNLIPLNGAVESIDTPFTLFLFYFLKRWIVHFLCPTFHLEAERSDVENLSLQSTDRSNFFKPMELLNRKRYKKVRIILLDLTCAFLTFLSPF